MLEKTLESPLDRKEIKPVNPKGNQSWIFIGRTDTEAETPILWLPDVKNWLVGKDPDSGKDWRQEDKGITDEMVGWHHRLDGHEFEQALGVGDGQGSLACCSPWGHKESDTTEWLNWTDWDILNHYFMFLLFCSLPCLPGTLITIGYTAWYYPTGHRVSFFLSSFLYISVFSSLFFILNYLSYLS